MQNSLAFAQQMLPRKIVMAPGRFFSVDLAATSRWSHFNVGAVTDPRFAKALHKALAQAAEMAERGP